jgi:signal transduction histidine kinase
MSALRLLIATTDAPYAGAFRDVFAAQLPEATAELLDAATMKTRPMADGVVIDGRADPAAGIALGARMRAMGFAGALVVVADDGGPADDARAPALAAAGAAVVRPGEIANRLVATLAEQLEQSGSEHAPDVMRARRLIAAGQIALGFQHSLNNPLAGILAEAQLMQLDPVTAEQNEALERIVMLCRRIVEMGRSLDGMGERR